MDYTSDNRIILLLDAGGTNFVFTAIQNGEEVISPIRKPSNADNLELCLQTLVDGFEEVIQQTSSKPAAISFAFPGPADYPNGIIGDLTNLPAFRGGVALGPYLEAHFKIPVFINNDGDLFAYGEALAGILPDINLELEKAGNTRRYKNLLGITLGTGCGGGLVQNKNLVIGDNAIASEIWIFSNRYNPAVNAEEVISTRAVQNYYKIKSGRDTGNLMPKDIFDIATGSKEGDKTAALYAFERLGSYLGDMLANLLSLIDGIAVIGGGLSAASELYMPSLMEELNGHYTIPGSGEIPRMIQKVYNYDDLEAKTEFLKSVSKQIVVPNSDKTLNYDPVPKLAVATSKIGASKAISMGAYAFALQMLDS